MQRTLSSMRIDRQDVATAPWTELLSSSIHSAADLARFLPVDARSIEPVIKRYPMRINPYYLSLIEARHDPIWIQAVPDAKELTFSAGGPDPCNEGEQMPVPGLIHRYPDRVVLTAGSQCGVFCRHCMRKRAVGRSAAFTIDDLAGAAAYIARRSTIREVIISGGDPLLHSDATLTQLLKRLRAIAHVEILRVHTRVLCTLPQRITPALADVLSRFHPLYVNTQFNHPREITPAAARACDLLTRSGIPLGCQTVLLKGVNDDPQTIKELMRSLLRIRVKPYYIHHPDPVAGTDHLRVPVSTGLRIMQSLRGFTSGMAVPQYMIDLPGGGGKVPLLPEYVKKIEKDRIVVSSYEGKRYEYPLK